MQSWFWSMWHDLLREMYPNLTVIFLKGVFHGPRHCVLLLCMLISCSGDELCAHFWSSCLNVGFSNWWWWWQCWSPQTHSPPLALCSPQRMFCLCYSLWCRSPAWVSLVILLCCCGKWLNKLFPALGEFILEKGGLSCSGYHIHWAIELQVAKKKLGQISQAQPDTRF